ARIKLSVKVSLTCSCIADEVVNLYYTNVSLVVQFSKNNLHSSEACCFKAFQASISLASSSRFVQQRLL
ncbi:hypothetical protein M3650_22700, partial [Paenibacillus sp. MER TA 81-3]|uniref:hypothetical protein n=1 Tax=Paenibacillus sp. MER TA 81-3 TaxID=2939573 RepID=UPI0020410BA1